MERAEANLFFPPCRSNVFCSCRALSIGLSHLQPNGGFTANAEHLGARRLLQCAHSTISAYHPIVGTPSSRRSSRVARAPCGNIVAQVAREGHFHCRHEIDDMHSCSCSAACAGMAQAQARNVRADNFDLFNIYVLSLGKNDPVDGHRLTYDAGLVLHPCRNPQIALQIGWRWSCRRDVPVTLRTEFFDRSQ
jgi:hypothetical protein